uniref:Uncharacterized protein n=1 Tax=Mycena chlorophos TaxID=658473 RepID=A0ABQ0LTA2_MYCCL|nr:predicted protein [Mycena chlorophos]
MVSPTPALVILVVLISGLFNARGVAARPQAFEISAVFNSAETGTSESDEVEPLGIAAAVAAPEGDYINVLNGTGRGNPMGG